MRADMNGVCVRADLDYVCLRADMSCVCVRADMTSRGPQTARAWTPSSRPTSSDSAIVVAPVKTLLEVCSGAVTNAILALLTNINPNDVIFNLHGHRPHSSRPQWKALLITR